MARRLIADAAEVKAREYMLESNKNPLLLLISEVIATIHLTVAETGMCGRILQYHFGSTEDCATV